MPGPVVNGVRQSDSRGHQAISSEQNGTFLPLVAEGSIRLLLLTSGELLMARLRQTTDRDGDPAYQLIRPQRVCRAQNLDPAMPFPWVLEPFLEGLTQQESLVLFKAALGSILTPDARLLQAYTEITAQECPIEETPVERLKRAFQEFTESFEADQHNV